MNQRTFSQAKRIAQLEFNNLRHTEIEKATAELDKIPQWIDFDAVFNKTTTDAVIKNILETTALMYKPEKTAKMKWYATGYRETVALGWTGGNDIISTSDNGFTTSNIKGLDQVISRAFSKLKGFRDRRAELNEKIATLRNATEKENDAIRKIFTDFELKFLRENGDTDAKSAASELVSAMSKLLK